MAAQQSALFCAAFAALAFCALFGLAAAQTESMASITTAPTEAETTVTARTFGHHFLKRISFAMLPAAFVVGVITTLLAALTVVSMKGLGVGVILLVIALGQMLGRLLPAASTPAFAPVQYQAPVQAAQYWRR